jgi:hypothetical protein
LQVFVDRNSFATVRRAIDAGLPDRFREWPTRFGWDAVPVSHHVEVAALEEWLQEKLGFDARRGVSVLDWLVTPQQILLEIAAGAVFHDGSGKLAAVRAALAWYPDDVWLWLLACQWRRIDQEEPFVGRTAEVGDELGSRVIAARLARDAMRLGFLLERCYAPYSKWLGSAFSQLEMSAALGPLLLDAVSALERVIDPWLRSLPLVGAIDQFVDSVDVLSGHRAFPRVATVYERWSGAI